MKRASLCLHLLHSTEIPPKNEHNRRQQDERDNECWEH
ncbi:hypothetical protein ALT1000_70107 [Alteromonas macleodii]